MDMDRFTDLLDAWGADLGRWPSAEREAADRLLESSTAARALLREAAHVDALLLNAALPEIEPSDALRSRVLAHMQTGVATHPVIASGWRSQIVEALALLFPTGRAVPQFAALALALAIGIGAGFTNVALLDTQNDIVTLQYAAATPVSLED